MRSFGEILIDAGLVTRDELQRAQTVQRRTGERLGAILAAMGIADTNAIDHAWLDAVLKPAIVAAVDRACANRFSPAGQTLGTGIRYLNAVRRDEVVENLLDGGKLVEAGQRIEATIALRIGKAESIPFEVGMDLASGFIVLDDRAEAIVRRWVDLCERGIAKGAA